MYGAAAAAAAVAASCAAGMSPAAPNTSCDAVAMATPWSTAFNSGGDFKDAVHLSPFDNLGGPHAAADPQSSAVISSTLTDGIRRAASSGGGSNHVVRNSVDFGAADNERKVPASGKKKRFA